MSKCSGEKDNSKQKSAPHQGGNPTIKVEVLAKFLQGFDLDESSYLIDGSSHGLRIDSKGLDGRRNEVSNPRLTCSQY